jgi:hypothetical protein
MYSILGEYIGHGLYEEQNFIDNIYLNESDASLRVKYLKDHNYDAWVDERKVKE